MINLLFRLGLWPARRLPQCFDEHTLPFNPYGAKVLAMHMAEATPHRRLS